MAAAGDDRRGQAANDMVEADPAKTAAMAHERCDALASHPKDPGRMAAAVSDEQVVPGRALPACEEAVKLNPESGRAHFQLGRLYQLAARYPEAFDSFTIAASYDYPIAFKYVGDAYLEGRGLPDEAPKEDAERYKLARNYYLKSADAGYAEGSAAVAEADELIRSATFDPSRFQNPQAIRAIYEGNFLRSDTAVLNAYYAKGLIEQMDNSDQFFMDAECKPLIYKISTTVVDVQVMLSYAQGLRSGEDALKALVSYAVSDYATDMGRRDAINLMNIHKCNSPITKRIVDNIILTSNSSS
ncbi:sel1 repeat family protein [Sphingomonas suaedae]|uniref:Sel1 repeat family protein n=2 Tax=Sphingomonas suaedae TaxID=2599297 RepID=A0A518RD27_9SPHN|nr:sel1 repeat family protein [Sphingomonas suaedae]